MELPIKYTETMKNMLGPDFDDYIDSFSDKRLYGLRVNTLKISVEEFLKISPFELEPIPWIENGFYYREEDKPAKHPYYFAGLYYIQEPSAMTPANVLPVSEGDVVFDMCAAPGGKSTELGAKLNRTGLLVSNDISASRAKALLKNIEVCGIPNVMVINEDPSTIADRYEGFFDKVLIDAPCSGEGMFRKDNKLIKAWEKNGPEFYHNIQKNIILYGAKMLKPGGMMVYSTCTFSELEDEESVMVCLKNCPDMELVDIKGYEGFSHGFANNDERKEAHLEKCVRIFPHKMAGEGHFVALFKKKDQGGSYGHNSGPSKTRIPAQLQEFLSKIKMPIDVNDIVIDREWVYAIPRQAGDTGRLRKLRSGLLLGELKKDRFDPSQALAMALRSDEYPDIINLSVNDDNVVKYLKGETIDVDNPDNIKGWCLVCVDSYPLGWGKISGTTIKNKYLAGWRWM